ncbi:hypothetical protein H6G36_25705 [Anabaena minutissima FACHB-250]|nr:hypothetical protein [Anabaena minutissima FACHB-250]
MARVSLTGRVFSDFNAELSEVLSVNFKSSVEGKININSFAHTAITNLAGSITSTVSQNNEETQAIASSKRAMILDIDTDSKDDVAMLSLRRRNLPLPPTGQLTILKSTGETPLANAVLRRGDTTIIQLIAIGDFPTEPEIVFAVKEDIGGNTLFLKTNQLTQGDIEVTDISPYESGIGSTQKLTAQIVIYPHNTSGLNGRKVLFYTVEIVDKLADEVYTLETNKFIVEPDVY